MKKESKNRRILKAVRSFVPRRIVSGGKEHQYDYFEGIVLCADISGFTAMSEKLTSSGKEGSEEISKIINSFFEPLVKIINNYGGDIFFFGGDAITAVFSSDMADRAVYSAHEAVKLINEKGRISTSQGKFSISIHIALTKGKIFYKQTKRLYMLSGNTCYRVMRLLDKAKKQQIIIDSSVRDSADNIKYKTMQRGVHKVTKITGSSKKQVLSIPDESSKNISTEIKRLYQYVPEWLERRIQIKQTFSPKDGEHRKAAVVFLHFRKIPFDKYPEKASGQVEKIGEDIDTISEKYGGWVNKIDFYNNAIRALVIFGFPRKLPNDESHAVMFAQEILSKKELKNIDMRIGVNSGLIYGTPIGSNIRREYTVMGDTVNTAARIASKAKSREITVGENVFEKTSHVFNYSKTRAKAFKGKSRKVHNYIFRGTRSEKGHIRRMGEWISQSSKLIGHKEEIKHFHNAMNTVKGGNGQIIAFTGEAGLGKSRMIAELADAANGEGYKVYQGNCISYGQAFSYHPWIEIFNRVFKLLPDESNAKKKRKILKVMKATGDDAKTWLPLIGEIMGIDLGMNDIVKNLDSKIKKQKFFDIVLGILDSIASKHPLCIVIEDVHWMDSISMELLQYITRNIEERKILVLLAYRPIKEELEFRQKDYCREFLMKELSEYETLELVENLLDIRKLPESLKTLVIKKTQGNPFYVEEIVKSLVEQGYVELKKKKWVFTGDTRKITLPDSVEGVILTRIDRLDLIERDVLQVASVLGREFDYTLLKGVYSDTKRLTKSLNVLKTLDLLKKHEVNKDRYFFKHILTQETAYNTLSFEKKRDLHHNVASLIERKYKKNIDEQSGILSYHYYKAKDYENSLVYSVKAGDKAKDVYANDEAIEFYTRA
ncbi:MAG: AAA family ATPase, partial [bacterium]